MAILPRGKEDGQTLGTDGGEVKVEVEVEVEVEVTVTAGEYKRQ